jgi:hypothetical protein
MKLTVTAVLAFMMAGGCLAANAHIGTWKFNEAKSKMPDGMGRYSTVTYSEQGDKIKVTTDGTDTDGKPKHSVWLGKFDGKAYPVKGSPSYNAVGLRVLNDHANFVQALKNGKVMWWGDDHDLQKWQNAHSEPALDRCEREEVQRQKGL